ncbi:MAG: Gfo/Idh/MocA family oxidoreductase [Pirellulaceae bacterium]
MDWLGWDTIGKLDTLRPSGGSGDRFQITAICSGVALRAERIAAEFNSVAVDGFRALARREDVDAVMILSPEWYGSLPILAACESSKAIYCAGV